jgi:hypothetical protein
MSEREDMKMTTERYNGWKNWETWNVALWVGNEEGLYRATRDEAQRKGFSAETAEEWAREIMPNGTPDFKSKLHGKGKGARLYDAVDWDAIAEAWNEE